MSEWQKIKLREILEESKIPESNEDIHKRLSVKLHMGGVFPREVRDTDKIGSTKYYHRKVGQFIYGKQNLHNGAIGIVPEELDGYQSSSDLPTFDIAEFVNKNWLYYYFARKSFYNSLERLSNGTGSKRIKPDELLNIEVSLPPLAEQQKIAAILTSVDEVIEQTEKIIKQTETVKKGLMQQLLTKGIGHSQFKKTPLGKIPINWKLVTLEEIADKDRNAIKPGPFGSALKKEFYVNKGYKVYGQEQVIPNDFSKGDYYVDEERYFSLQSFKIKPGDLLISLVGTYGKIAIVPEDVEPGIINPRLLKITFDKTIASVKYYKYFMSSKIFYNQLSKYSQGGTMGVINSKTLKSIYYPCPPLYEQIKIYQTIKSFDNKISHEQFKLTKLIQLKQGLMQQLLTGKVRVPIDDNEEVPS
ncbi:restriction endonuclease subunit S [Gracilibacillus sp. YIM 98692]|uniref:restriction endonuclease subunit S n=1 Tax=Gracilibacillus sp. YIM 98692 TaxID=2663532 RepID=UPI0013D50CAA|nr:restriction endonuclease subunit S [Gracilibacillus sp. YIM 98692]